MKNYAFFYSSKVINLKFEFKLNENFRNLFTKLLFFKCHIIYSILIKPFLGTPNRAIQTFITAYNCVLNDLDPCHRFSLQSFFSFCTFLSFKTIYIILTRKKHIFHIKSVFVLTLSLSISFSLHKFTFCI